MADLSISEVSDSRYTLDGRPRDGAVSLGRIGTCEVTRSSATSKSRCLLTAPGERLSSVAISTADSSCSSISPRICSLVSFIDLAISSVD